MSHQTLKSKGINFKNLTELLAYRADTEPDKIAYTFLLDKEGEKHVITYRELTQYAMSVASELSEKGQEGDRVIIICKPSLSYIIGFFACLYAGMIAVPVYPPRNKKHLPRLSNIIDDAQSHIALTTQDLFKKNDEFSSLGFSRIISIDAISPNAITEAYNVADSNVNDLAFLQYTSGSTGQPKGVMLSHGNLLQNLEIICRGFRTSEDMVGVSWLPPYHDMGLIGAILHPMYAGFSMVLMAPEKFLQRPAIWLKVMSDYKAAISAGPNFAYQLCADKLSDEDCEGLDLSHWKVAINGAEPVRRDTLEAFSERFSKYGFNKSSFRPSYGLAESTLYVSGENKNITYTQVMFDRVLLSQGSAQEVLIQPNETVGDDDVTTLVSSGKISRDHKLLICNPDNKERCSANEVGEIWLSGSSIGQGYWQKEEASEEAFNAYEKTSNVGPFFRTGDLGFVRKGELFITGRLKDLIIITGKNYYPQDIEDSLSGVIPAVRSGCCVAFSTEGEKKEELVIIAEVERQYRKSNLTEVCKEISLLVAKEHHLSVNQIVLIAPASIPKTSSGKVQRRLAAKMLKKKELNTLENWTLASKAKIEPQLPQRVQLSSESSAEKAESIKQWLMGYAETRINSRLIDERRCIPPHIVLDFGEQGIMGMQIPTEHGGLALNTRDTLRTIEHLCAVDSTLAFFVGLNNTLGIRPIQYFGNDELKSRLLPKLAEGRILASFALTEESAGSNPGSIQSTATPTGHNNWLLNGKKIWSGTSAWASVITVIAKNTDSNGMTAFAAEQGIKGMRMGNEDLTMGVRGMVQNDIHFENAEVPETAILGNIGAGMDVAQDTMTFARLGFGALGTGGMKHCAQLMLRYGKHRTISTGLLLDNPLYRQRLGRINSRINALENFVYGVADCIDLNIPVPTEIYLISKIMGSEFLYESADELMQAVAGRGYIETNYIPQLLRDARLTRIFEGPTETLQAYLGARLLKMPEELQAFMRTQFNAEDQYKQLLDVASQLNNQLPNLSVSLGGRHLAVQLINSTLGEIVPWTVLKASTTHLAATTPSEKNLRTLAWLSEHYDLLIHRALTEIKSTQTASTSELIKDIEEYTADIGNIERYSAGAKQDTHDELRVDPLLNTKKNVHSRSRIISATDGPLIEKISEPVLEGKEEVKQWLRDWVASATGVDLSTIGTSIPFAAMGVDSIQATELSLDFTVTYDVEIYPTVAWEYPDIEQLSTYLAQLILDNKAESKPNTSSA